MKLLVDESLSARVAALLVEAGHDALHIGDLNLLGAPDTGVMAAARRDRRCVVSVDTDFAELLVTALPLLEDDLDIGAIVVLTPRPSPSPPPPDLIPGQQPTSALGFVVSTSGRGPWLRFRRAVELIDP